MSEYTTRLWGLVLLFAVSALSCWICYCYGWEEGGRLSDPNGMVFACFACNQKKADKEVDSDWNIR